MIKRVIQFALRPFGLRLARAGLDEQVVAPFDVLQHVVFKLARDRGERFRFLQFGEPGHALRDRLAPMVSAYGLRGSVVAQPAAGQGMAATFGSPECADLALLYLDTARDADRIIAQAFEAGVFPGAISYTSAGLSPERRHHTKLSLLDRGYRFLDVGANTICVRQ